LRKRRKFVIALAFSPMVCWCAKVICRNDRYRKSDELVITDASDELIHEIESIVNRSRAKLIEQRKSTTTLERLFLDATKRTALDVK